MSTITYCGISIDTESIKSYLYSLKKSKSKLSYNEWREEHCSHLLLSILSSMANNKVEVNINDSTSCSLIEQIIRELGYDENGRYTAEAKQAMANLNRKRGLDPNFIELNDIKIQKKWKQKVKDIGKKIASAGATLVHLPKKLWEKGKKYILGTVLVGASLFAVKPAIGFYNSFIKPKLEKIIPQPVRTEVSEVSNDTTSWHEVTKNDTLAQKQSSKTNSDTLATIIKNKQKYQSTVNTEKKASQNSQAKDKSTQQKQIVANNSNKQNHAKINSDNLSIEIAQNLEKACNRAPTIVINDLQKKGILPANYRSSTLKKYLEKHPRSHISEVPSRILLNDLQKVYNQKEHSQTIADYVNTNQKRFLYEMKVSQKKHNNQLQKIKNLKQLRDLHNR